MSQKASEIDILLQNAYLLRVKDLEQSLILANQALKHSLKINDQARIAASLSRLSLFNMIKANYEEAQNQAADAIEYYKLLGDEVGVADARYNIAGINYKTDNFHLGLVNLLECLEIYKKHQLYAQISRTLKSMGTIYDYFGDHDNARKVYEDAVEAAQRIPDTDLISNAYNPLSGLFLKLNQPESAMSLIQSAIELKTASGDIRGLAFSIYGRGKVHAYLNEFEEAKADYFEALRIHEEMGEKLGKGMVLFKIGVLYKARNLKEEAQVWLSKSYEFARSFNMNYVRSKSILELYQVHKSMGNQEEAMKCLEEYTSLREFVVQNQTRMVIKNYELIAEMKNKENQAKLEKEKAEMLEKQTIIEKTARAKQDFLSMMSHEIRTPLNAIISISYMLNDEQLDEEDKKLLQSMKLASSNLLTLINDILDFTKLDSGKLNIEPHPVALKNFLQNITETYKAMAQEKGLLLQLKIDTVIQDCYKVDETKLGQILSNLISNGIKYTEKGKVELIVKRSSTTGLKDTIQFCVKDSGIGVSKDQQNLIFESFYRPDSVTTRKESGTGLGLSIVRKLVELYGSEINITSATGEGSEFYFELELEICKSPQPVNVKQNSTLQGRYALIAEDNPVNAIVSRKLLANWGAMSDLATNGKEAIKLAEKKKYDFILMDIHMPEMNGIEAASTIRKTDNPNQNIPIYALTADITADSENLGIFTQILKKPIEIEKLFEVLSEA